MINFIDFLIVKITAKTKTNQFSQYKKNFSNLKRIQKSKNLHTKPFATPVLDEPPPPATKT